VHNLQILAMNAQTDQHGSLIDQLEDALGSKDFGRRAEVLRRVTDLFALRSGAFSEDQVALFDVVMSRLLENIESAARAQFGSRLAKLPDAPRGVIRLLAQDDAIQVAGPVLTHSERLDVETLVDTARTKSQDHLLAISGRKVLAEAVTDVLVDRGNRAVVSATAHNAGAKFSEFGVSTLVRKALDDSDLALCIWSRPDIPRQDLIKLFVDASEAVKHQLVEADPRRAELIKSMVAQATDDIQAKARAGSNDFARAAQEVRELNAAGQLNEDRLIAFADEGSFDKIVAALSVMCDIPIGSVERAFVQKQTEQIVVIARALDLSWATTLKFLLMHAGVNGSSRQQLDVTFANFFRLQPETARMALKFYRMREKAGRAK
jgi:uncharacterized protein (DUF2336 family)